MRSRKVPARSGRWSRRARPVTSRRRCLVLRVSDPARRRLSAPGFRLYRVTLEGVRHLSSFLYHSLTTSYEHLCRIVLRLRLAGLRCLFIPGILTLSTPTVPRICSIKYPALRGPHRHAILLRPHRSDYMHLPSPQSLRKDPSPTLVVVAKEPHPKGLHTKLHAPVTGSPITEHPPHRRPSHLERLCDGAWRCTRVGK